jgi:hypothetical protein
MLNSHDTDSFLYVFFFRRAIAFLAPALGWSAAHSSHLARLPEMLGAELFQPEAARMKPS